MRSFVMALFAVPLLLADQCAVVLFAPTHVTISTAAIAISRANSYQHYKPKQILAAQVDGDELGRAVIRLTYPTRQGQEQTRTLAVGNKIDLLELADLLNSIIAKSARS